MAVIAATLENLTFDLTQEIDVRAPLVPAFSALLEQMGAGNEGPDGSPMPMTLEAWPGGRWFRDLGDGNGHLWGHVQAIKRPSLLEICGPLFMSLPVVSNVQYRLTEVSGGTQISLRHTALGLVPDNYRAGLGQGWTSLLNAVRARAERS
jgi:hypothetical protein